MGLNDKYIILVRSVEAPSKSQISNGIILLTEKEKSILRNLKDGVESSDAATIGQVQRFIDTLIENYKNVISNPVVSNSLSKDGNIVIFEGNTGKIIRDSGTKISDLEPKITYTNNVNDYYAGDGSFYPLPMLGGFKVNQVVSGTKDGSNTTFTVPDVYVPGSLMIIRNGLFDLDITEDAYPSDQFEINDPPTSSESLIAIYKDPAALGLPELNVSPIGTQDGTNTTFNAPSDYVSGSLMLIRNGLFDFNITEGVSPQFTITDPPESSENLKLVYIKQI